MQNDVGEPQTNPQFSQINSFGATRQSAARCSPAGEPVSRFTSRFTTSACPCSNKWLDQSQLTTGCGWEVRARDFGGARERGRDHRGRPDRHHREQPRHRRRARYPTDQHRSERDGLHSVNRAQIYDLAGMRSCSSGSPSGTMARRRSKSSILA